MCIYIGAIWIKAQKEEFNYAFKGMYTAMETKEIYEKEITGKIDGDIHVSYWIRIDGKPYVFVTTEAVPTKNYFDNSKKSIIGCGFSAPSKVVQWSTGKQTQVFDFDNNEISDHGCEMDPRVEPITSIVCSSYVPSEASSFESTVGICVFAGGVNSILVEGKDYRKI